MLNATKPVGFGRCSCQTLADAPALALKACCCAGRLCVYPRGHRAL
eukprot:CAMPEP_0203925966 /NCGR_PEP_ID=MMETSP0359-20131031/65535_1 /ASSEMBLY_ACC=CAM_ASM_000338 /TAXON_ID=268821 /ORGANISM="Scrippsiella Hangoei, Strain SHTV-5" /LENGTH=45 /DNA_ID= /DNA_START= /DNA_END= /DNA_ORIENTATION=